MSDKMEDSSLVEDTFDSVSESKGPERIVKDVQELASKTNYKLDGIITYMREKRSVDVNELLSVFSKKTIQFALMKRVLVKLNRHEQILITIGSEADILLYYKMCRIEAEMMTGYNYWS